MYLEELNLYNFRQYKMKEDDNPGISVNFNSSFNLLIGENDAGKSAIIDGVKLLLGSVDDIFDKITLDDFYSEDEEIAEQFFIEGIFTNLSSIESGMFLEWIDLVEGEFKLRVLLKATRKINNKGVEYIDKKIFGGSLNNETILENPAKTYLRTTYLKPLRNAKTELNPGFKSRLANILKVHPAFGTNEEDVHDLVKIMSTANKEIESYFEKDFIEGHSIKGDIENLLYSFYDKFDSNKSKIAFKMSETNLASILRKLSLENKEINLGLGNLNLLFIATELLLLSKVDDNHSDIGPNITLIEELEAHLHPQAQIRLVKYLEKELERNNNQFILTTHSPNIVSSVNPKNIILIKDSIAFSMQEKYTELSEQDYLFLERFLDVTKSNLFFAKGIIFVEGVSELLLIPSLAKLLGYPLHEYGVTIINIQGTSFERYIKLFSRNELWKETLNRPSINIPISIITDIDVKPLVYYEYENKKNDFYSIELTQKEELQEIIGEIDEKLWESIFDRQFNTKNQLLDTLPVQIASPQTEQIEELARKSVDENRIECYKCNVKEKINKKYREYDCNLKVCISPEWTLEYCLAKSKLANLLSKSIFENRYSERYKATHTFNNTIDVSNNTEVYELFKPINEKVVSKAEVAQYMSILIENKLEQDSENVENFRKDLNSDDSIRYIIEAIEHVVDIGKEDEINGSTN